MLTKFALTRFPSGGLIQGSVRCGLPPKMHQSGVHCDPMEPRRKSRLAAECGKFSESLNERFLRQVVGIGGVVRHAQTYRINSPFMRLEQC